LGRVVPFDVKRTRKREVREPQEVLIQQKRLRLPLEWQQEATSFWIESGRTLPVCCQEELDANWAAAIDAVVTGFMLLG
jgi:hypothetical protein